jgi:hypothetical protein
LPEQPGAPHFDVKEVSRFVRSWERFAEQYRFATERIVTDLEDYCALSISRYVVALIDIVRQELQEVTCWSLVATAPKVPSWSAVRRMLLQKFKSEDTEQQRNTVAYLLALSFNQSF